MWNETCAKIFAECIRQFNENNIKYFLLRNYQGLPQVNKAKDIDIVIEPKKIKNAKKLLYNIFKNNGLEYYDEFITGKMICMHGMSMDRKMGIHIDLLAGLNIKGYGIFCFDEMYQHTEMYNNIFVLEEPYGTFLLFISKLFGQKRPKLKNEYKNQIKKMLVNDSEIFLEYLSEVVSAKYVKKIDGLIKKKDFNKILSDDKNLNKEIRKKILKKKPVYTLKGKLEFAFSKAKIIVFQYRKYSRNFAVIAPDGTGKSSFTQQVIEKINYYYVADQKVRLYHFRPEIFPNLRVIGQKTGITGEKKATTNPHEFEPAGKISSFFRMFYYTADYILGWRKCIRNDVHYDRYSVFDRYSYDLLVDPLRSRIQLPYSVRKLFVKLTPKPKIVFLLKARPEIIYNRKQELTIDEIKRMLNEYEKIANKYKNVYEIDAEDSLDNMSEYAMKILFENYAKHN